MGNNELLVCGNNEVSILRISSQKPDEYEKIWSWKAKDSDEIPEIYWDRYNSLDECKPFENGNKILITSSGNGVALIDRELNKVIFYAFVPNAHSADILPNNRIAVASSIIEGGNRLIVFNQDNSNVELLSYDLPFAHGIVWDKQRQKLWALTDAEIRVYELKDWNTENPRLDKILTIDCPDQKGHDLFPVPNSPNLTVTFKETCWNFNRDTLEFSPLFELKNFHKVKSICIHFSSSQIVYIQGEASWWAEKIHFLNPEKKLNFPGKKLYKARWIS